MSNEDIAKALDSLQRQLSIWKWLSGALMAVLATAIALVAFPEPPSRIVLKNEHGELTLEPDSIWMGGKGGQVAIGVHHSASILVHAGPAEFRAAAYDNGEVGKAFATWSYHPSDVRGQESYSLEISNPEDLRRACRPEGADADANVTRDGR